MPQPNFILLYVESPTRSADFYATLLGRGPVELSPTFAMYALDSGVMLGLWGRQGVEPAAAPDAKSFGGEVAFSVEGRARVSELHGEWSARGLRIAQPLTQMDFGYTFVALDPDGHRLRVFAPGEGS